MHPLFPLPRRFAPPARGWLLLLALGSGAALAAALIAQYVFLLHPCHLCLLQRYPHAAVLALGAIGAKWPRNPVLSRALLALCALLLLAGLGIAAYHTGVEQGIFPGPHSCVSAPAADDSLEAMRRAIMEAPIVACDQPMGHVLGLSLAAWSALIYLFLTILALYGLYDTRRVRTAP